MTAWQTLPHQQLYDLVNKGPGREASRAHEQVWAQVQKAIDDGHTSLRQVLGRSAEEWIGAASQSMQAAVQPFAGWCATAVDDAGGIATSLAAQGEHAARLRQLMPGPSGFKSTVIDIGKNAVNVSSPGLAGVPDQINPVNQVADSMRESTSEAEDARRLMSSYDDDSTQRASGLGFWTTPPTMVVTQGPPEPPSPGGPGAAPHAGGPGGSPNPALPAPQSTPPVSVPGGAPPPRVDATAPAPGPGVPSPIAPNPTRPGGQPPGLPGQAPVLPTENNARPAPRPQSPPAQPAPGIRGTGADLPIGQGGRGVKPAPFPQSPRPTGPSTQNPSSWRELVAGQPRTTRPPVVSEPFVRGGPAGEPIPGTPGRAAAEGRPGGMYPPMAGAGAGGGGGRTKGRPGYLEDDSGFFADDRWVSEAVIGQDDVLPEIDDR